MHAWTAGLVAGALSLCISPAAGARVEATETVRRSFELPTVAGRRYLLVDNVSGSIRVEARASGDRVELELVQRFRADSVAALARARAEAKLTVEQEPGRLALVQDGPFRCDRAEHRYLCRESREHRDWEVVFDWVLTVPRDLDLDVRTVNEGGVHVSGVGGRIEAANVNGAIELRDVAGSVRAVTVNGPVEASFRERPTGDLSFQSVNGELDLSFPSGFGAELAAQTMNGEVWTDFDFEPGVARRSVARAGRRAKLSGSAIRIGGGGPKLECQTINGDILIRERG